MRTIAMFDRVLDTMPIIEMYERSKSGKNTGYQSMCLANGGHRGDFGNCTATASWQGPACVNISCGNLSLAGIHCVLMILDY
jgi:hypothetical protein